MVGVKKRKPVVLLFANRQGYFSREFLQGVLSMRGHGCDWEVLLMPVIYEKRHLKAYLHAMQVSGVIARGMGQEMLALLAEMELPVVAIRGMETESHDFANGPHVDDQAIGEKAGQEFMHLNLRYWGFIHWEGVVWSEARMKSFSSYASTLNVNTSTLSLQVEERHSWKGVLKIRAWLDSLSKPCGILACNDEAGLDVLQACQLAGLSVPEQVAVIGVDNDRLLCESTVPPLSSIDLHAADIGKAAACQLRGMLSHERWDDRALNPSQASVVVRESSHEIDRYLLIYQRAMDHIQSKALTGISVLELAEACGVSRRGMERAFIKQSGKSPAAVIRSYRLTGILELLKNQSMNLECLAQQTGFSDAVGLSNFVKRMTGRSPGSFR